MNDSTTVAAEHRTPRMKNAIQLAASLWSPKPSPRALPVLGQRTVLLLLTTALASALLASEPPSRSGQPDAVESWLSRQADIHTWSAEFIQTRALKTLTQPLTARGRLWYAAPDRFRWELGNPPVTVAIRQPNQMFVIYPVLKRAERYPLGGNQAGQWESALALLEAGFPRDRADLESKFRITGTEKTNEFLTLNLQPKSASARRMIPKIQVVLSTNDFSLRATELQFPDGSTLRNDFIHPELNPKIDDSLFQPQLGSDYKMIEPLKR